MACHTVRPRSHAVVECTMRVADTTPLHAHEEDETIEILEGSVTVYAGDETVTLTAGQSHLAAAGVPHAHRRRRSGCSHRGREPHRGSQRPGRAAGRPAVRADTVSAA
jgi:mannose-6-phosphate isomerase-like protein (cupin superfamily)